ncbi:hypothetical protein ACFL0N_03185 [Pseudomonadota bacterium]
MLKILFPALIGLCWLVPVSAQDDFSPGYRASYKVTFEAGWSEATPGIESMAETGAKGSLLMEQLVNVAGLECE